MQKFDSDKLAQTHLAPSDAIAHLPVWPSAISRICETIDHVALASATNALTLVNQPTVAIDRFGVVLEANKEAHHIFDGDLKVRNRRLTTTDREAMASLQNFIDQLPNAASNASLATQSIIVRRKDKSAIIIRALPVRPFAQGWFPGAYALLTFSVVGRRLQLDQRLLRRVFLLTPAEARLAALVAAGASLEAAAEELAVKRETARNQLKAIFAKTGTHRQGQLVALLSTLCSFA